MTLAARAKARRSWQLVKLKRRGVDTLEDLREGLRLKGYKEDQIADLVEDYIIWLMSDEDKLPERYWKWGIESSVRKFGRR